MGRILIFTVIKYLFLFFIIYLFIYLLSLVSLHFIFSVRINDQLNHYPEEFRKDVLLKISQCWQEKSCARVSFLIKLQAWGCEFR